MSLKSLNVAVTFNVQMTKWNDTKSVEDLFRDADVVLDSGDDHDATIHDVELEHTQVLSEGRTAKCANLECTQRDTYEDDVDLFDNVVDVEKATPKGNPYIIGTCPACGGHVYRIKD